MWSLEDLAKRTSAVDFGLGVLSSVLAFFAAIMTFAILMEGSWGPAVSGTIASTLVVPCNDGGVFVLECLIVALLGTLTAWVIYHRVEVVMWLVTDGLPLTFLLVVVGGTLYISGLPIRFVCK